MKPQLPRMTLPSVAGNPRQYDTGSEYTRLVALTRILSAYSILVTVAFLIAAATIWTLFPLKTIVPQFVYFSDKREQVVTVEPGNVSQNTADLIIKKQLEGYVVDRETINCIDEGDRYARLQRLSDTETFRAFKSMMDPNVNTQSPIKSYCQNNMAREIHVESVIPNNYAEGIYTVDFITTDRKVDNVLSRKERVATIQYTISKLETNGEHAAENPVGMTIIGYQTADRNTEAVDAPTKKAPQPAAAPADANAIIDEQAE